MKLNLPQFVAALLMCGLPVSTTAEMQLTETLAYDCRQPAPERLECDYRPLDGSVVQAVTAAVGAEPLPAPVHAAYPAAGGTTAVLFLVDTSDPRRKPVIDAIKRQFPALMEKAQPHQRFGLAVFDSELRLLAPLGSDNQEVLAKAQTMAAVGKTTELYRSALEGLKLLAAYPADRRALYIFSDGLAEDYAYHHEDVIPKAREANIPIISLGYPRSVALSVGLQTLRKLSEDTGGLFTETSITDYLLPATFLDNPYAAIEDGGHITVDLSPARDARLGGAQQVTLKLAAGPKEIAITTPVELPALPPPEPAPRVVGPPPTPAVEIAPPPAPGATTAPMPAPVAMPPAAAPNVARTFPPKTLDSWIWYGTPAAFLFAVMLALFLYPRLMRRRELAAATAVPTDKPFAYLVQQGPEQTRHIIAQTPWRIGRGHNNELTINDQSVSRQHAEIHRRNDGKFEIADLESLNGVFVNDKKVKLAELAEGDTVDIGDMTFKFTRFDNGHAAQEPTIMIRTRTP